MNKNAITKTVLVIDDEEAIRISFQGFLEDCEYIVHTASNGKEGINQFIEIQPQLVLVDLRMPEMNGLEVVKYIAQNDKYCPIIVVSGTGVIDDAIEAVHFGAWDYITKPIADFSILTHAITKALEKSKLLRENDEYKHNLENLIEDQTKELIEAHQKLKKQYSELEIAKKKAEENDKLKSAFLANMSHEIRTPMNGILGFAEILKDQSIDSETQREYLDLIIECGDRMVGILNDLIDISRIEANQMDLKIEDININQLLKQMFNFFTPQAKSKQLKLFYSTPLPDSKVTIKTDGTKLSQIITNLIRNAIKFTYKGSINFGYTLKDSALEFFIEDTGIGIDSKFQNTIFNRFVQAESDYTKSYDGAGLGLSISKAYVEMLGGKIWYESHPNVKTQFSFTLPYISSDNENKTDTIDIETHSQWTGKKILIVEDDIPSQLYLKRILESDGLTVSIVSNGQKAIESIQQNKHFDLVLMDIRMPGINGFEASQKIKKLYPNLPIIIQSAYSTEKDLLEAKDAGCEGYITKPVKKDDLFNIIEKIFNHQLN